MNFQKLYLKYCNAVVFLEVEDESGDLGAGTAFHIGDGVYLTAKHVVENRRIKSIQSTTRGRDRIGETKVDWQETRITVTKDYKQYNREFGEIVLGPFADEFDDVAVFTAKGIDAPAIRLGLLSYDYMFDDDETILSKVLVLGYPRIAFSEEPRLVATKAEVSTIIDKFKSVPPYFIISAMARGGFSGGPCIAKDGECLGLVTESLISDDQTTETGFMSVLTMKPILRVLVEYNLVPKDAEGLVDEMIFNWRRPEDPPGMSYKSLDSIVQKRLLENSGTHFFDERI